MSADPRKLRAHIFICTNERAPGHPRGCCKEKGSEKLVELFKEELAKRGLKAEIRAQKAGCLDTCEWGPSVVVYPEGIWYGKVTPSDVSVIIEEHLVHGKPVERLKIPGK
jgi:(2Fe-2S) ferredoxin